MKYIIVYIFFLIGCGDNPINKSEDLKNLRVETTFVTDINTNSATINWTCSSSAEGLLYYGYPDPNIPIYIPVSATFHRINLNNLRENTEYQYLPFCGQEFNSLFELTIPIKFFTLAAPPQPIPMTEINNRSIFIFGGLSSSNSFVSQVEQYDPVENQMYYDITRMPTPRSHAGILSLNGKIYIIGGLYQNELNQIGVTNTVEEYDPESKTWRTMSAMPTPLQGFILGKVENTIYAFGGSTTTNIQTGTLTNTVYRFNPYQGEKGIWSTLISANAISPKIDMGGCAIDGTIFYAGGRLSSDGSVQSTNDAYVPTSNSNTNITETALNLGRHGVASSCYSPKTTDPFPNDPKALLIVGGSTNSSLLQPIVSPNPSQAFDYYLPNNSTLNPNTMSVGPNLPVALYYPAMEISYISRKAILFGGRDNSSAPQTSIYSINLSNPLGSTWEQVSTQMQIARYAHMVISLR